MRKLFGLLFVLAATVMGLSAALGPDGVPVYTEWKPEAVDELYAQIKMLDADQKGVDRSKLRVFYTQMGWNDIQKGLDALISSGRAEASTTHENGRPVEVFTWKAV